MRIQTDAFEIIEFILSFIPDELSGGKIPDQNLLSSNSRFLLFNDLDQDEIEITLRDCCQFILQQLCDECHCKFRLQKDNRKVHLSILSALSHSFEQFLQLLNFTRNPQKIHLINDLCFNIALYNGEEAMIKYLQYIFTRNTSVKEEKRI